MRPTNKSVYLFDAGLATHFAEHKGATRRNLLHIFTPRASTSDAPIAPRLAESSHFYVNAHKRAAKLKADTVRRFEIETRTFHIFVSGLSRCNALVAPVQSFGAETTQRNSVRK